jgi:hypothetical protein
VSTFLIHYIKKIADEVKRGRGRNTLSRLRIEQLISDRLQLEQAMCETG